MISLPVDFCQRVLDMACAIQQTPSPTFNEGERADLVLRLFTELGLQGAHIDASGNVLACLPGRTQGRPLVFSAHMDTVFPKNSLLALERRPGKITGPGIGDNSLGLAGLAFIPELLQIGKHTNPGDIWLAGTVCEEGLGNLRGIQALTERFGSQPLAYISIEGMGLGNVLHRGLGVERYRVSVKTPGGHSWVDFGSPSAIHELALIAGKLVVLRIPRQPRTTLNIGVIQGGTSINSIASKAWMDLDLRSESARQLQDLTSRVQQILAGSYKKDVDVSMERIGWRPAGDLPADHPLVILVSDILTTLGVAPHLDIASTEANQPLSKGYPSLTIGLTTGDHAHSTQEYIDTQPLEKGLQQLYELAARIQELN
jgi:acetylornithine deacetylase/succinyl-diaminopimelate desuccinylase-like protein